MKRLAAMLAVVALIAAGCAESGDTGDDTTDTTEKSSTAKTTSTPQTQGALRGLPQFKACARKAGAKLQREPPTLDGRIAVGAAGNLPATYVGAVVWPNDAYMDVWLADNADDGAETADRLNEAEANAQGVAEVEAAFNRGRAVGAPGNTEAFGNLPSGGAAKIDACLDAVNR